MYLSECIEKYLSSVKLSRSANTYRTYHNAMDLLRCLTRHDLDAEKAEVSELSEDAVVWMASALKNILPQASKFT